MNSRYAQSQRGQLGCLIIHERNQWAYDEGCTASRDSRQLVAKALSCAGRHDQQEVAARKRGLANLLLVGSEPRKPKHGVQQSGQIC